MSDAPALHLFLLSLACLLIYSNSFHVPFVFDDEDSIVQNEVLRKIGNFTQTSAGYRYNPSRYVGYLSFAVNYRFSGLEVTGYHIGNLLIHLLNSLLVYRLVLLTFHTPLLRSSRLTPITRSIAFFTASFFAVHPVQTQAVTYIVQRVTSLAALFYLASIYCYARARLEDESGDASFKRVLFPYLLSLLAALLAMKTKEISFTLPFAVTLYETLFFKGGWKRRAGFLAPILLTLMVVPLGLLSAAKPLRDMLSDVADVTKVHTTLSRREYLMTQFCVIATYIRLLFLPYGQNLDYDFPVYRSFFHPRVFSSFLFLAALFLTALLWIRKSRKDADSHLRLAAFGILWFFLALSVESSVIPIADVIFEHRLYLPSVGAAMTLAVAVGSFATRQDRSRNRKIVAAAGILILLCFSYATYQRNRIWQSGVTLWDDVVKKSPGKARPLNQLGIALSSSGRNDEAAETLNQAIRIDPTYAKAYNNLGIARSRQGLQEEAERMFSNAIRLNPEFAEAYYNLGRIYLVHQGQYDRAIGMLQKAVTLKPDYTNAFVNLAAAYNETGAFGKAVEALETSVPDSRRSPEALYHLGVAYRGWGNKDAAIGQLEKLREKDPALARRLEQVIYGPPGVKP